MVYDIKWLIYLIVSSALTVAILVLLHYTVKKQTTKEAWLKVFALLTLLSHISIYYYNYVVLHSSDAGISTFFPIYPCNVTMMLFPLAFFFEGKTKNFILVFLGYFGIFGGIITVFEPSSFYGGGNIFEWGTFKSFLSHSIMLLTSLYCFTSGIIKIEIKNLLYFIMGLVGIFFPIGLIINYTLLKFGHDPNSMYLRYLPIDGVEFLNPYMIAFLMTLVILFFITIYDRIAKPLNERWYVIVMKWVNSKKNKQNLIEQEELLNN